jgi:cell division protein FtsW
VLLLCALPAIAVLAREHYRWIRLTAFVDPWKYADTIGFQLVQSFLALGRGGVMGVGLGQSMQKLDYLPEVHTDFIFSVVGEELGFVRAVVVVSLFGLLFWRGVRVALRTEDPFSYYLAFGLSVMIALQAVVNFGVVTGLLPTKGLPLPFMSYGGSSLLINMTAVGLLLNISRGGRRVAGRADTLDVALRAKKARRAVYGRGI